jgi:hypothetical protein
MVDLVAKELSIEEPDIQFRNRSNIATFRKSNGKIMISFKNDITDYDDDFIEKLVYYTMAKLTGKTYSDKFNQTKNSLVQKMNNLVENNQKRSDVKRPNPTAHLGIHWNLREIYDKVFSEFRLLFEPIYGNSPPYLTWTKRDTFRIMAQYTFGENKITMSKTLDQPDTPEIVLKYLMFHELLHGLVGRGSNSSLNSINASKNNRPHCGMFRRYEAIFPDREKAEKLLKIISINAEKRIKHKKSKLI